MSMFKAGPRHRFQSMAKKLLLACAAVAIIPACGQNPKNDPPGILTFFPSATTNIPLVMIIYVDWDRALDPTTVPGCMTITDNLGGSPGGTISYNAVNNELSLTPGTLVAGRTYTVAILGTLQSSNGVPFGGAVFMFTASSAPPAGTASVVQPSFVGVNMATAGTQSVTLAWTPATDASEAVVYDVYMSTVLSGEDFALGPVKTETVLTGGTTVTGLTTGQIYYFIVRARGATSGNIDFNVAWVSATPT